MVCSSLCFHAEWKSAACVWVEKTDYCCLTGTDWCVCALLLSSAWVTASDSPKLCEQHSWKVSYLCLQIDMISAHCQSPFQTLAYGHAYTLTQPWSLLLSVCFSTAFPLASCVYLCLTNASFVRNNTRGSLTRDWVVMLWKALEEHSHWTSHFHTSTQIDTAAAA